jgi:hypothetical protein
MSEGKIVVPELRDYLEKHFRQRVNHYADALRRLADDIEREAMQLGKQPGMLSRPISATDITQRIQHAIEWGLANASFSSVITAAADYDRGEKEGL